MVSRHKRRSDPLVKEKQNILKCVRKFNENPKAGIQLLGKFQLLDTEDPEKIADFLWREGRLSKKKIGEYLGTRADINIEVITPFSWITRHIVQIERLLGYEKNCKKIEAAMRKPLQRASNEPPKE